MELDEQHKNFSTNDIVAKMSKSLNDLGYFEHESNEKKVMIDSCLRDYLASKVLELDSSIEVSNLSSCELMKLLDEKTPELNKDEALRHVPFYLLSAIGIFQGWEVMWEIDDKVTEPVLIFKGGILDELITSHDINYYKSFGILYEQFSKDITKKINTKGDVVKLTLETEE